MYELFSLLAGIATALIVRRWIPVRLRGAATLTLSLIFGVTSSATTGEVFESPAFILVDTALVLLAAVVTAVVVARWQRQPNRA